MIRDYKKEIGKIIDSHFPIKSDFDLLMVSSNFRFYVLRIAVIFKYGLVQGRELRKMICRAAFNDETLSESEAIAIIETCVDPRLDNLLLEVNYNEGWQ